MKIDKQMSRILEPVRRLFLARQVGHDGAAPNLVRSVAESALLSPDSLSAAGARAASLQNPIASRLHSASSVTASAPP